MQVLVVNCGSSSIKYQLFDMLHERVLGRGLVDRIGLEGALLVHQPDGDGGQKVEIENSVPDHGVGVQMVVEALQHPEHGVIEDLSGIRAIGHRVVHGGEDFSGSVKIDPEVLNEIHRCSELAPLHNPANIVGIEACQDLLPHIPQVAVFDTAFHQTIPPHAFIYGIPYEYYEKYRVRRYGFHGTSHKYVAQRALSLLGRPESEAKIVTAHLGNGCSLAAVDGGVSVDTSMGLGTLPGPIMGTRCGDVDPMVLTYLMEKEEIDPVSLSNILHKKSGLLALSGVSSDVRDIEQAEQEGNKRARLALDIFAYLNRKYIGSYAAAMGGLDALVFTAGIGENGIGIRERICRGLEFLGAELDPQRNQVRSQEVEISREGSRVKIFVIPTNEELAIARETREVLGL